MIDSILQVQGYRVIDLDMVTGQQLVGPRKAATADARVDRR